MASLIIRRLRNQLKKICKDQNIVDIIIFGSSVKAKDDPKDIDLALILHREDYTVIEKISAEVRVALKGKNVHLEPLIVTTLFKEPLYLTLIHEGFSIKSNSFLATQLGTKSLILITYSLISLSHSKKTLFGYALKGRKNQKGFIDQVEGKTVGRNNVLVPTENYEQLNAFFKTWSIPTKKQRFLRISTLI